MRKCIATVSVSGTLPEKLSAIAAAGFDGIELFENDLLACPLPPEEIRERVRDLGLLIDLYQPFRDFEAVPDERLAANLRRAEHKFQLMERLGADLLLVCSNVSPRAIGDDDLAAEHLRQLAVRAAEHGIRVAYEALAWGRHVSEYLHAWRIVRTADHPNLGVCLDSFHILSRGSDPIGIEAIPGQKIFFVQLSDAPPLAMDVLQWSRHYRCFPGQGSFDLAGLTIHALNAGYTGPLSLEVFNDVFRQADAARTAVDGMRSLIALEEALDGRTALPPPPEGFAFAELTMADLRPVGELLRALGFTHAGTHHSKPVELWAQGGARILLNAIGDEAELSAIGLQVADPASSVKRAEALLSPVLPRERDPEDARLDAVAAPDGAQMFFCGTEEPPEWLAEFSPFSPAGSAPGVITHIDHVALTQPLHYFDEAELFYRTVLCLRPHERLDMPDPYGLVRSRAMSSPGGAVRMVLNVANVGALDVPWQHVALATGDIMAVARRLREGLGGAGDIVLPIPGNYYDDLAARYDIGPALGQLRELDILYDRDEHGEFLHLYTVTIGRVFFEIVQRIGGYDGYGAANAPVRLAAQHAQHAGAA
ncbi:sugar phosphate isomerase/epimerase and 4-hydroxyphenylpyruvate domain-containing protein [Streptosporangiaceae bacterium NEAU-GS5]|nr:sugar phosphate isomerase/epimerase and 4-hydroxyphenylpyruvate domain-containing protein [Streptosporangiaceae bacterium NEAU-GS5]